MTNLDGVLMGVPPNVCQTKIVCTLGPKSRSVEVLEELLRAGMNVARFNFSHGDHDYHKETLDNLRQAVKNTGIMVAVALDTKGPEIRTGFLKDGKPVKFEAGREITISTDYSKVGDDYNLTCTYKPLARDVKPGSSILCADGSLVLEVIETDEAAGTVRARCTNTATLGERKNMNLPGVVVDLPTLTEKDEKDLVNFAVAYDLDIIFASFVRKGEDLDNIRKVLGEKGKDIHITSKLPYSFVEQLPGCYQFTTVGAVENQQVIQNFDEILAKSDSIMVARGETGMEIPTEKIFLAQKMMIQKCNFAGKPVIVATQMLESMIKNPQPTRAEATDVANAVLEGADCVMLSGETAAGDYPVEAVRVMTQICREAEASMDYYRLFKNILKQVPLPMSPLESLALSAVRTAHKVHAALIIVLTRGGSTGRLVAKYKPSIPVLTVAVPVLTTDNLSWKCSGERPARLCQMTRGLIPILAEGSARASDADTTDEILSAAIEHAKHMKLTKAGDCVVALHGIASVIKIVDIQA